MLPDSTYSFPFILWLSRIWSNSKIWIIHASFNEIVTTPATLIVEYKKTALLHKNLPIFVITIFVKILKWVSERICSNLHNLQLSLFQEVNPSWILWEIKHAHHDWLRMTAEQDLDAHHITNHDKQS